MAYQESSGLLSPFLRRKRLRKTASFVRENSSVLDLACGAGYLKSFIPPTCDYFGVDRLVDDELRIDKENFLELDLTEESAFCSIASWRGENFDYITAIAFLEHISDVGLFLRDIRQLLNKNGVFIGTTPHPSGRRLHDILARTGVCAREAAEEHQDFLDEDTLRQLGSQQSLNLFRYDRFLFGLNQFFAFKLQD